MLYSEKGTAIGKKENWKNRKLKKEDTKIPHNQN